MITLYTSPDTINVGSTCEVSVGLGNSGTKPVYHVDVRFRFPSGLAHMRGSKAISVAKLNPGQERLTTMYVKARRPGTHAIGLRSSSYKDAYGRTHPIEASLSLESVLADRKQRAATGADKESRSQEGTAPHKQFVVFLSYAQKGRPGIVGRLYDRLADIFGPSRIFFDQNDAANPPGELFPPTLKRAIFESQVVLLLIDDRWKEKVYQAPVQESPASSVTPWLRMEAEYAWHYNCACIPVLIGDTSDLDESRLPTNLKPVATARYMRLRFNRDFDRDVRDIVDLLRRKSIQ